MRLPLAVLFAALSVGVLASRASAAAGDLPPEVAAALSGIRPEALRAHVRFLGDDLLEGRGTATRGYDLAAAYVAAQLEAMGLEPGGERGGYFQTVPLRSARLASDGGAVTLVREGKEEPLAFETDFAMGPDYLRDDAAIEAPVAFVGFGVTAPELGHDDYGSTDVRGKVVAVFRGAPASFPADQRAYYSSGSVKMRNALARGAVGILRLPTPSDEKRVRWELALRYLRLPGYRWLDAQGRPYDEPEAIRGAALLSRSGAEALFRGAPRSFDEVGQAAEAGRPQSFPLPVAARMRRSSVHASARTANVVGVLRGSDPLLAGEYVVFSAHLDHLGITDPVEGDGIHNGAYDNASGVSAMLEVARAFAALPRRPRRSLVFLAVAAEEKGLLGAEFFARNPTVPAAGIVADVNLDMFLALYPIRDVVAFGGPHSSLGPVVEREARRLGLGMSPDPFPEEVIFIRSDQYAFVERGVPAVMLSPGLQSADPNQDGAALTHAWLRSVYHSPKDDLSQPVHEPSAVKAAQLHFLIGYDLAQADARPAWNPGDFFGEMFGKPTR